MMSKFATDARRLKCGLHVARVLIPHRCTDVPVLVRNTTTRNIKLQHNDILTELLPVSLLVDDETYRPTMNQTMTILFAHIHPIVDKVDESISEDDKCKLRKILEHFLFFLNTIYTSVSHLLLNMKSMWATLGLLNRN